MNPRVRSVSIKVERCVASALLRTRNRRRDSSTAKTQTKESDAVKITLTPNENPPVRSYTAHLPDGSAALVEKVEGHGWVLTLRYSDGMVVTQHGLFETLEEVVRVLEAQYAERPRKNKSER